MLMEAKKKFEGLGTKIDPAMFEVLNACCDALGVDDVEWEQVVAETVPQKVRELNLRAFRAGRAAAEK